MNDAEKYGCVECGNQVFWTRHTQFSGSHYFCKEHATKQSDFSVLTDCADWEYKVYAVPKAHRSPSGALKSM